MDGECFFPTGGSLVWIRPYLKETTGGGNGPFPLGATDLVEEMSALLARRKRNAEKGSTVEREQKEDKTEDSEPVTPKASSTSTPEPTEKPWERTNTMNGSTPPVVCRCDSPKKNQIFLTTGPMIHSTDQTLHPGHRAMPAESRRSPRTRTEEAGQFRWNEKRIQSKEKLIDAIKPEVRKSNAA